MGAYKLSLVVENGTRSAIIGARIGRHLGNVGLDICTAKNRVCEVARIAIVIGIAFVAFWGQSAKAGFCDPQSQTVTEFFVPEYICFGIAGGTIFSAACATGRLVGYKPVHFGTACEEHDRCYATKENSKLKCDEEFRELLYLTCDETLTGKYR